MVRGEEGGRCQNTGRGCPPAAGSCGTTAPPAFDCEGRLERPLLTMAKGRRPPRKEETQGRFARPPRKEDRQSTAAQPFCELNCSRHSPFCEG